ncbi:hypothetical protein CEXT_541421 [Caerostris extrusa]|uniref:Uncharacterized protein n=1 Tax=Caerostris extrusa TaxID=172846 RepID=A0AAV4XC63_CAEEX|nr:hypothetical protein CEXT_541421 [Caerostris extrusa]
MTHKDQDNLMDNAFIFELRKFRLKLVKKINKIIIPIPLKVSVSIASQISPWFENPTDFETQPHFASSSVASLGAHPPTNLSGPCRCDPTGPVHLEAAAEDQSRNSPGPRRQPLRIVSYDTCEQTSNIQPFEKRVVTPLTTLSRTQIWKCDSCSNWLRIDTIPEWQEAGPVYREEEKLIVRDGDNNNNGIAVAKLVKTRLCQIVREGIVELSNVVMGLGIIFVFCSFIYLFVLSGKKNDG